MGEGNPYDLLHNFRIHIIMWFRTSQALVFFDKLFSGEESISKIHVAVFVNIPMLPRLKGKRKSSVRGFRQIHQYTFPPMQCRVRNNNPKMLFTHIVWTPNKCISDSQMV